MWKNRSRRGAGGNSDSPAPAVRTGEAELEMVVRKAITLGLSGKRASEHISYARSLTESRLQINSVPQMRGEKHSVDGPRRAASPWSPNFG